MALYRLFQANLSTFEDAPYHIARLGAKEDFEGDQ
jgi:hypothetical protein